MSEIQNNRIGDGLTSVNVLRNSRVLQNDVTYEKPASWYFMDLGCDCPLVQEIEN